MQAFQIVLWLVHPESVDIENYLGMVSLHKKIDDNKGSYSAEAQKRNTSLLLWYEILTVHGFS